MSNAMDQEREWAIWALEQWSTFPVNRDPRPLVLVGPRIRTDQGFSSATAKIAFLTGAIDGDASVPPAVLELLRATDWSGTMSLEPARPVVRNARLSEAEFMTDRGRQMLPAWRLESDGVIGSIWVLDPESVRTEWRLPEPPLRPAPFPGIPHRAQAASIDPDDRHLDFRFVGRPENLADYRSAEVIESPTAVVVLPTMMYREPFGPHSIVSPVGRTRSVSVELGAPLGARVLVDLDARPVVVSRADGD